MQALIDFIQGIAEGVRSAIDFLFGIIEDTAYMVKLLSQFVLDIPSYLSWFPPAIVSTFITIFSIVIVYKILGREG